MGEANRVSVVVPTLDEAENIDDFRGLVPDALLTRLDALSPRAADRGARSRGSPTAGGAVERLS